VTQNSVEEGEVLIMSMPGKRGVRNAVLVCVVERKASVTTFRHKNNRVYTVKVLFHCGSPLSTDRVTGQVTEHLVGLGNRVRGLINCAGAICL
jgi:hypothetical protein